MFLSAYSINTASALDITNPCILDFNRSQGLSNKNGIAYLNLKIIGAKEGHYVLLFQSGGTISTRVTTVSRSILVKNKIQNVTIVNNFTQTIEVF
jgi:hypothetical protein